jgi:chromate transporter
MAFASSRPLDRWSKSAAPRSVAACAFFDDAPLMTAESTAARDSPLAIFLRFLRFGCLAWGGPVAQIAMIRRELVDEAKWIDGPGFNRLLAAYQVLPGPEAHELCVHLGTSRGGRLGGILAGLGFMLPGFLLVLALSALYARIAIDQPPLAAIFLGMQIGVLAIIARAVLRIGGDILSDRWTWAIAILTFAATMAGLSFWILLPAAGAAYALERRGSAIAAVAVLVLSLAAGYALMSPDTQSAAPPNGAAVTAGAAALFWTGLKAGLLTFGGAYTAIPFVRDDAVGRGWLSDGQFLDGLALSGIVPAPLIIFATFVGFQVAGLAGAVAITAGIFLPAFLFGTLFHASIERITADTRLHDFLEGVAAGVVGIIAATALDIAIKLWPSIPVPLTAVAIFVVGLAIAYFWRSKLAVLAVIAASALGGLIAF